MMSFIQRLFGGAVAGATHPLDADRHLIDAAGWLHGPRAVRVPADSSWFGGPIITREPVAIVWHYTHTAPGTAAAMAKRRTRQRNPTTDRAASWHFTIERRPDGKIWQMIPCLSSAWHCAKGKIGAAAVNRCTIGIELVGDGTSFTEGQVDAALDLVRALAEVYGITRDNAARNHSDFDPSRRRDAGPVWNGKHLPRILAATYDLPAMRG